MARLFKCLDYTVRGIFFLANFFKLVSKKKNNKILWVKFADLQWVGSMVLILCCIMLNVRALPQLFLGIHLGCSMFWLGFYGCMGILLSCKKRLRRVSDFLIILMSHANFWAKFFLTVHNSVDNIHDINWHLCWYYVILRSPPRSTDFPPFHRHLPKLTAINCQCRSSNGDTEIRE